MTNAQIIYALFGTISALSGVIAFLYRDSSARSREYADEWRTLYKEQLKVIDENTRNQEQIVATVASLQKSEESAAAMLRDIWYQVAADTRPAIESTPPPTPRLPRGGTRDAR